MMVPHFNPNSEVKVPKGRDNTAQGNALGNHQTKGKP